MLAPVDQIETTVQCNELYDQPCQGDEHDRNPGERQCQDAFDPRDVLLVSQQHVRQAVTSPVGHGGEPEEYSEIDPEQVDVADGLQAVHPQEFEEKDVETRQDNNEQAVPVQVFGRPVVCIDEAKLRVLRRKHETREGCNEPRHDDKMEHEQLNDHPVFIRNESLDHYSPDHEEGQQPDHVDRSRLPSISSVCRRFSGVLTCWNCFLHRDANCRRRILRQGRPRRRR